MPCRTNFEFCSANLRSLSTCFTDLKYVEKNYDIKGSGPVTTQPGWRLEYTSGRFQSTQKVGLLGKCLHPVSFQRLRNISFKSNRFKVRVFLVLSSHRR